MSIHTDLDSGLDQKGPCSRINRDTVYPPVCAGFAFWLAGHPHLIDLLARAGAGNVVKHGIDGAGEWDVSAKAFWINDDRQHTIADRIPAFMHGIGDRSTKQCGTKDFAEQGKPVALVLAKAGKGSLWLLEHHRCVSGWQTLVVDQRARADFLARIIGDPRLA